MGTLAEIKRLEMSTTIKDGPQAIIRQLIPTKLEVVISKEGKRPQSLVEVHVTRNYLKFQAPPAVEVSKPLHSVPHLLCPSNRQVGGVWFP
ncbi:hypothetical protein Pyn_01572 [Prunus yedoensis var. nudiflora]|uniref:Uncharacterized protein n=1 Tax=Prunus yedoensis var. nudiflora TaxID=2094558 RepID=A0A314YLB1_PRUYE|nr:hypothetical protein Pyn_01572 [Prunus yedoensis var. nudiflora]